jgi:nucleoside-triphosphatase THEP1
MKSEIRIWLWILVPLVIALVVIPLRKRKINEYYDSLNIKATEYLRIEIAARKSLLEDIATSMAECKTIDGIEELERKSSKVLIEVQGLLNEQEKIVQDLDKQRANSIKYWYMPINIRSLSNGSQTVQLKP